MPSPLTTRATHDALSLFDRRRGDDGRRGRPRHPRSRPDRHRRSYLRRAAPTLRSPSALQRAVEGRSRSRYLARHRDHWRGAAARPPRHGDRCAAKGGYGTPRRLPLDTQQIIYFRTYDDYRRLRALANERLRFAVLGGGFIGSEIAAALKLAGREVVMLVPEDGIGARVFPADLSHFLVGYYREQGVEVRTGEGLAGLTPSAGTVIVQTTHGQEFPADVVVAGLGIQPNVDLAEQAGLRVDNGIVVDELLRTSAPDIFAAGDVANFFNPALGTRMRVEHEDNANTMGTAAGRAMAGHGAPYTHLPFFYSDLFSLGYEAVGELDPRFETFADWKDPFREGVVYYLKDGRVRGVLLWNVWGQVDAARQLIGAPGLFSPQALKGRLAA